MKKYELLLFDADGTLFDYDKGEVFALKKSLEYYNVNFEESRHLKTYRKINSGIWAEFERKLITADKLKTERFRRFFEELDLDIPDIEFGKMYLDNLAQARFLLPNSLELLENLKGKFKLGLITNGLKRVQRSRLDGSEIEKYFEYIIISEEIGVPKPEPGIFDEAFKICDHADKNTTMIIGDNLSSDIKGGVNYRIDTCWYNPAKKELSNGIIPTYEINDLLELNKIVF